jgi:hypothetical protein
VTCGLWQKSRPSCKRFKAPSVISKQLRIEMDWGEFISFS